LTFFAEQKSLDKTGATPYRWPSVIGTVFRMVEQGLPSEISTKTNGARIVTAVARGISILEAFDGAHPELGITEIAKRAGLSKTTTFRLVQTLVACRYLELSPEKKCRLGSRLVSLGFTALETMDLRNIASPPLRTLSHRCGETVNMAVQDGDDLVYIERIKTQQIVNINLHIGSRLNLYNTSMGRALLSHRPESWLREYIRRTKTKPEAKPFFGKGGKQLLQLLETVRTKRYAINDEDLVIGLRSIATPVWNAEREVVAAINIAVPSARVTVRELVTSFAPMLIETAEKISEALGYRGRGQIHLASGS
jgi:IclR family pca regulon transcriptional regulator